jgi:major membrane immunogen (membrane-anchored lipoprotein)
VSFRSKITQWSATDLMRALNLAIVSAVLLAGCATTNDSGVRLYKKPDLSGIAPGTPISRVAALRKPISRNIISDGEWKGAEVWHYEWDAPDDDVNNKMFTAVLVKDGVIMNYSEDTTDKWRKDTRLHKAAKFESALEDIAALNATAARYQLAAAILSGGGSAGSALATGPAGYANSFLNAAPQNQGLASGYRPLAPASPATYGITAGRPIAYGGQQSLSRMPQTRTYRTDGLGGYRGSDGTRIRSDGLGGYRVKDGTGTTRFRSDGLGGYRGSDGTRVRSDGLGGFRVTE